MLQVTDKSKCCGCGACAAACPKQCIAMEPDEEGFMYPQVDRGNCVNCGLCETVCPVDHREKIKNIPTAYAAWNTDEQIRMESSSGGMFTLFAEAMINSGGVVFGARFDEQFRVVHDYTETVKGLRAFRGSKYLQSQVGDAYHIVKQFLIQGKIVLFSGTPCQIAGLRSFLGREYEKLICMDIVCHGVPSPLIWEKYLAHREKQVTSQVQRVTFRDKKNGWRNYQVLIGFKSGDTYFCPCADDEYMKVFLRDICLRPSCYDCAFKSLHRESDITLADFWGVEALYPEMFDDKGTSLLILNSERGKQLFEQVKDAACFREADLEQALRYNPAMIRSARPNQKRDAFLAQLDKKDFDRLVKDFCSVSRARKLKNRVIGMTGALLRKLSLLSDKC